MESGPLHFKGEIVEEDGKNRLKITTETSYKRIIASFKKGDKVMCTVERLKPYRSRQQNSYYWLYLGVIANETGNLETSLHEHFKRVLLPPMYITGYGGAEIKIPASTTDLSKSEFAEYIMKIQALTDIAPPDIEAAGFIPNNKNY